MSMGSGWYAQWIQVGMENGEQYRCPVNAWIYHGCEFISQGQCDIIISLISELFTSFYKGLGEEMEVF